MPTWFWYENFWWAQNRAHPKQNYFWGREMKTLFSLACLLANVVCLAADATPSLPDFAPPVEIAAPPLAAPEIDLASRLDSVPPASSNLPPEHGDLTAYRALQQHVSEQLQQRKKAPPQSIDYRKQPAFAHHCIKLNFVSNGQPELLNQCGQTVNIAYCWLGIAQADGANDCALNQYALSHGGRIYGFDEKRAHYGLFIFACTAGGHPHQLKFDNTKQQIMGQCFW